MTGNLAINSGSPELYFGTTGNHYNWRIAAQELVNEGFEIAVGSQDTDYSNDTYVNKFVVKASGNVGIGTNSPQDALDLYDADDNVGIYFHTATSGVGGGDGLRVGFNNTHAFVWNYENTPISFGTNGSQKATILANGNVGIGESNPATKLDVAGLIKVAENSNTAFYGGDYVRVFGSGQEYGFRNSGGATKANISMSGNSYFNGGNVGIGTSSPTAKLQISYNGGHTSGNVALANSSLDLYNPLAANTDEKGSVLTFSDNYFGGSSYSRTTRAAIKGGTDTVGNTADGFLAFYTDSGGANSMPERMRINHDGYVGIGTDAPTHKLHVAGDIRIDNGSALKLYNAAGNGWAQIAYNNTLDHIEIQRSFQSGTDSYYNLGSSAKKWLSVYSDTIKAGNGTAAAPTYTFDSDQNTGMYVDSTGDRLNFSTGGARRMLLDSAGVQSDANVYTASGSSFRNYGGTWRATTGTAAGDFEFRGNTGGTNTGLMYMDTSTGRVAVGNGFNSTNVKAALQIEVLGIETNQSSVTSTSQYTCESFPAADFRSARYTVQITNVTDSTYHVTEILLIHDGTTPAITEFATIFTGSVAEATFDADINSGNVRLLATPASTDNMQFKVVRHSILV